MNKPQQADFILNHPLIQEFFQKLHEQVYSGIKKAQSSETRDKLAAYGRYADEFEQFFRSYVTTGELERIQAEERTRLQKMKDKLFNGRRETP